MVRYCIELISQSFHSSQASEADPNSLWEDEDTRFFYEGITDIKPFVPAVRYT